MNFPEVPRVFYKKSPLSEVEARAFFAPDLRIDTEKPVEVQQVIKSNFPIYERKAEEEEHGAGDITHIFKSEDGVWTIELSNDQVSLHTNEYSTWDEFSNKLRTIIDRVANVYKLSHYLIIALKYTDIIDRESLGFPSGTPWSRLIQPHILGEIATPPITEKDVVGSLKRFMLQFPERNLHLGVTHGLAEAEGQPEMAYLIDFTFFHKQKLEVAHVLQNFGSCNGTARNFFRWCITEELHTKMEPEEAH